MSEVTLPPARNSPTSTTVSSSVSPRPSVLTSAPRQPYFTATESAEHVRRVSPSIHADELHPLATGTLTLSNNNLSRNNSGSSSSSGSSTNRGSSSLNSEVRRFFRGTTSLVSSNSPLHDRRARQQSPQSYSHRQHNTLYHITNIGNNNNTVHRSSSSSSGNTTNNVERRSHTHVTHPPTAPSSNRRSKYPMALPTEINQVYDGPVRGTAIIDSNYILDSSPVFEMITTPMSTHRLKKRLSSDVAMRSNSNSLCDNPVTATTSSSDNNNNPDEDDDENDEEKEAAGSDGNINSTSQECNSYMNSKNNSKIDKGTNTKREGEQECNLQVSLFESLPSKCTNEENSSPIIIQADNTGRLYRSNSSRLSMHGSFRMMKGSTTTSSSNNNNNNENSPETSFVNKSLPSVVCTSKACETSSNNNPIHVATNNVNNENASITYTVPNEHQEGAAATNINSNNNNVNSNTNLEHSREQQRHDGTNLFSLHHNNEGSTNVLESTATNHVTNNVSTHNDNTSNNTNVSNNNSREVESLVEREHVNEQESQQEEQRQGSNDVNLTNRNNNNNDDDNVLPMTRFEEEPQAMPETGNNNNNNTSNDVNGSQRMTNENAVNDNIVEANEPLTNNNTSTRDALPSCPCRERIEPLQVLNGDYVLFSDSFIESDPSSIVAVMTHEFKQTCVRCNTMPNKATNAERTRLQAVREVLAEAEVECRPLFRRVPSEIVYGSASYLPEDDNTEAERSIHAIVEDHEVPIQEEQTEESTTTNNDIEVYQNKKNVEKTVLKKATNNKNRNKISKLSEHDKKTNRDNTNGDCLTIRQITEELEQNTPRI